MPTPNIIAYLVLALWPFVAWQLWRRLDPGRALIWTILGGYLFGLVGGAVATTIGATGAADAGGAAGVPLACDEPAGFKTFRLGLFGLDTRQYLRLTIGTAVGYAALSTWELSGTDASADAWLMEALRFSALVVITIWMSFIGGYIVALLGYTWFTSTSQSSNEAAQSASPISVTLLQGNIPHSGKFYIP